MATIPGGAVAIHGYAEIKSKFDAEFRRFSLDKSRFDTFEAFRDMLESVHHLRHSSHPFHISYIDPKDNDLLPINNTVNYMRALQTAKPLLRLVIQRQGELEDSYYVGRGQKYNQSGYTSMLGPGGGKSGGKPLISISKPQEFRQVSSIIDVDVVPETCRRVRLLKHGSDKPLGFYIRDGTSVRVTPAGLEKVPGIFISRLLAGGLAESTGLLAVNDEVLEVNGIEVQGKSLDQVTDMMVANSSNLIVTVKPANQRTLMPRRGSFSRTGSGHGSTSMLSRGSSGNSGHGVGGGGGMMNHDVTGMSGGGGMNDDVDEVDEIRDLTNFGASATDGGPTGYVSSSTSSLLHHSSAAAAKKPVLHL